MEINTQVLPACPPSVRVIEQSSAEACSSLPMEINTQVLPECASVVERSNCLSLPIEANTYAPPGEDTPPLSQEHQLTDNQEVFSGNSTPITPPPLSSSQDSETVRAFLAEDVLLGSYESTTVTVNLACVNDVCEAICLPESVKVKNLLMESVLCSVAQDGSTSLFIYTRNTASFVYCPPRYVHSDFHIPAVLDLPHVPT